MFFRKKVKEVFNANSGPSADVRDEWVYRVHAPAREMLDAAAARMANAEDMADFIAGLSKTKARQKYDRRDRNLDSGDVFVATRDFHLKPLHGAASIKLIVPKGVTVTHDDLGHSDVYDMNDFSLKGYHSVDIHRNTAQVLRKRGCTPVDYEPPPPPPPATPAELAQKAVAHAQNGLPQDITVRRISLKPKAS